MSRLYFWNQSRNKPGDFSNIKEGRPEWLKHKRTQIISLVFFLSYFVAHLYLLLFTQTLTHSFNKCSLSSHSVLDTMLAS